MKIGIIVGTRPEIVKMAPVVRACRRRKVPYVFIHTGQHYSFELDGVFFKELKLPKPHYNLGAGSGSHAQQISRMIEGLESVLLTEKPSIVLVEGDTNSVLAGGIAANKLGIPVGHVEAGLRSYDRGMPEEVNRIVTDHLSDVLFAPTQATKKILLGEGIPAAKIHVTGNTVVDELLLQKSRGMKAVNLKALGIISKKYAIATVHRPENTENETRLRGILGGIDRVARLLKLTIVMPLHPRTKKRIVAMGWKPSGNIKELPPLGYLEFVGLQANAALILTDSGGVQEEACCLGVPCVTLRTSTERPESVEVGANILADAKVEAIVASARKMIQKRGDWKNPFGDGRAGERIIRIVEEL
ncbi:MAG: non-hydrolyzing UDP-N-acetylglucosamine 2-epimerase [Planctomycetota bacterium]